MKRHVLLMLSHIFMYLDILDNGQKDERFGEDPDPKTKGYKADEQQVSTLIENLHVVIISRLYVYRGRSRLIYSFANVFFIQIYKFRQLFLFMGERKNGSRFTWVLL